MRQLLSLQCIAFLTVLYLTTMLWSQADAGALETDGLVGEALYRSEANQDNIIPILGLAYNSSVLGIAWSDTQYGMEYIDTIAIGVYGILALPQVSMSNAYAPLNILLGVDIGHNTVGNLGLGGTVFTPHAAVSIGGMFSAGASTTVNDAGDPTPLIGGGIYLNIDFNHPVVFYVSLGVLADPNGNGLFLTESALGIGYRVSDM